MTDKGFVDVGVKVDDQGFSKLDRMIDTAYNQLVKMQQANVDVAKTADQAGNRMQQAFSSVGSTIDKDIKSVQQLRDEYIKAANAAEKAPKSKGLSLDRAENLLGRGGASLTGLFGASGAGGAVSGGADALQLIISTQEGLKGLAESLGVTNAASLTTAAGTKALAGSLLSAVAPIAPFVIALGGLALVAKQITDDMEKRTAAVIKSVDEQKAAFDRRASIEKAIESSSVQSSEARRKAILIEQAAANDNVNFISTKIAELTAQKNKSGNIFERADLEKSIDALKTKQDEAVLANQKLIDEYKDLTDKILPVVSALESQAKVSDAVTAAANRLSESYTKNVLQTAEAAKQAIIDQNSLKDLSLDSAKQRKDALEAEQKGLEEAIGIIKKSGDTSKEAAERLASYEASLKKNADAQKYLNDVVIPAAENAKKLADALGATNDVLKKGIDSVTNAAKDREKQFQTEVAIYQKYDTEKNSIIEAGSQEAIKIHEKYHDALVNAAEKAVDDANKALEQLNQQRASLATNLGRDEAKAEREAADQVITTRIKAQQQERDDLQQHLDNLNAIRNRDAQREQEDLLNRNYRDLFSLKSGKSSDMQGENTRFERQSQQRVQALQNEQSDQSRSLAIQRRERLISYQNAVSDAQQTYQQQLQQAQVAHQRAIQQSQQAQNKELADARTATNNKLSVLKAGAINEINLVSQTEAQKQALFQKQLNEVNALVGRAQSSSMVNLRGGASGEVTHRAGGGPLSAFQASLVNENGRESFNGAMFPPGLGVFIPAQAGNVTTNSNNTSNPTFNIYESNNPARTKQAIIAALREVTG